MRQKYVKQWFSGIGQQAVWDSDLWEKGTSKVSRKAPQAIVWREFLGFTEGRGVHTGPGSLP